MFSWALVCDLVKALWMQIESPKTPTLVTRTLSRTSQHEFTVVETPSLALALIIGTCPQYTFTTRSQVNLLK